MQTTTFIDLQVNGYAGVDFNRVDNTPEDMHHACEKLREDGIASFLPTIITDDLDAMIVKLQNLVRFREQDERVRDLVAGIHIEGPFLNPAPGYIGAHPASAACEADLDRAVSLLDAADGLTKIVTLAPEMDPGFRVTRFLAGQGIVVSAGHCNPTREQLEEAMDAGMSMFTHLGNGCPMELHRHDNIIQRVLGMADRLWISFIADGFHVPYVALRNYLQLIPEDRVIIISDAISAASLGPGAYTLGDREVVVGDDLVPRAGDGSHYVGSACPLRVMAARLQSEMGLSPEIVNRFTRTNPGRLLDNAH